MERGGFVYIITNKNNTTLYTGATSNLKSRIYQHKTKALPNSFSARYNLNKLVFYEYYHYIEEAYEREKQIKSWNRKKKLKLINDFNPQWRDLAQEIE